MKLSALMPCYNEAATIREIVAKVLAVQGIDLELIIVDDGSTDGTRDMLPKLAESDERVKVILHEKNAGKGSAIRTALKHATGDIVIIQDADLEYEPEEYPLLIKPIVDGKADAVYGSRFRGAHRSFMYWHYVGNKFLTFLTNILYNQILSDMETCYKAVRIEFMRSLDLQANRFDIEPEITAKLSRMGARFFEVPITYDGRGFEEGKKISWRDGFAAIWTLLKWRVKPLPKIGEETLLNISRMRRFNRWILDHARPVLGRRVLEAGCGIGNFTPLLFGRERVASVDIDDAYMVRMASEYEGREEFEAYTADLSDPALVDTLGEQSFDGIVCINVLEHIPDHEGALDVYHDVLAPRGKMFLLVPAHPKLFNSLDEGLDHCRRYTWNELEALVERHGFHVDRMQYFNLFGIPGWWVNGSLFRRKVLSGGGLWLYEMLVPIFRWIEKLTGPPIGLSLLVWAHRPEMDEARRTVVAESDESPTE